jgi:hypothetical protein
MIRTGASILSFFKRWLEHRYLPLLLALGAVLVMLPALKTRLFADDMMQWMVEMKPSQLPARIQETGIPANPGTFSTVMFNLFGLGRNPQSVPLMKQYGALPWWTPDDLKFSLCRPVAAFTHWLDYRLFPNSPALMHAHNILWFAADVFVLTFVYRKLMGPGWAAGLAALLFLLDGSTYFPVAFVANRGFFIGLFFGLLCVYEHHEWRTKKSRRAMLLSCLFLALSLYGEESGASTFAFILAYALVLEPGVMRERVLSLVPSVLVITAWQLLYMYSGYGLTRIELYLDPASHPLEYLRELPARVGTLLGSQFAGVAPELMFGLKPSLQPLVIAIYGLLAVAMILVFLPWVRRDKITAFWFTAMVLAAIPEAVLLPLSKNMGYVAVAAYGLLASFVAALVSHSSQLAERPGRRIPAWTAAVLLLLIHGPGAVAGRVAIAEIYSQAVPWAGHKPADWPGIAKQDIIVINSPLPLELAYVPGYKAYYHQPLPHSVRTLVPGCTGFKVLRTDARTLVIQSLGPDIFACDEVGTYHAAYALSQCARLCGNFPCHPGDQYRLGNLTVEILGLDAAQLPSRVAFHFDAPLEDPDFRFFYWDWPYWSAKPFKVPAIGQSVTLSGPQ